VYVSVIIVFGLFSSAGVFLDFRLNLVCFALLDCFYIYIMPVNLCFSWITEPKIVTVNPLMGRGVNWLCFAVRSNLHF